MYSCQTGQIPTGVNKLCADRGVGLKLILVLEVAALAQCQRSPIERLSSDGRRLQSCSFVVRARDQLMPPNKNQPLYMLCSFIGV